MARYLESLPSEVEVLSKVVLGHLRTGREGQYDVLSSQQQREFDELGEMVVSHLVETPEAAHLFGKLGPSEEAYGMNLTEVDAAVLRVHYYDQSGASVVSDQEMSQGPIDVEQFGTPHDHRGNIAAVVPAGRLVHHRFSQTDGEDYTAGHITFEEAEDPTRSYKFRRSVFVPSNQVGLDSIGSATATPREGYRMRKDGIHVVSWPEPTITVFFNDFSNPHNSTIFQKAGVTEDIGRPRSLTPDQRNHVWTSFVNLARKNV